MATGGKTPWDASGALTGPGRVLFAENTVASPSDLWDVIPAENTDGEYPPKTGWVDFGLAANAPQYTTARTTAALTYQQPSVVLYEVVDTVTRTLSVDIAEITPANLRIVENSTIANEAVAAATHKSAGTKIPLGLYDSLTTYHIAMVSFRPSGADDTTEGDGTIRPAACGLVFDTCRLSASSSAFAFDRGKPTDGTVEFTVYPTPGAATGTEHGYWFIETGSTILDV